MSLADKLAHAQPVRKNESQHGPLANCGRVYGSHPDLDHSTLTDWEAVETERNKTSWTKAQAAVDKLLGITDPIENRFFRYHWRRKCNCWPSDLRR